MCEAVEECGRHLGIAKDGRPFTKGQTGGDHKPADEIDGVEEAAAVSSWMAAIKDM